MSCGFLSMNFALLLLNVFLSTWFFFMLIIIFRLLTAKVQKCNWFLYIDFYPEMLLSLFTTSSSFLVNSLFLAYKITSSVNRDVVCFFLSSLDFFLTSVARLIALFRTSSKILNKGGISGHSYFVPDFMEKAFSLSLLKRLAVCFS